MFLLTLLTDIFSVYTQVLNCHFWTRVVQSDPVKVRAMVFNATFNNISVISWRSVLFKES